MRAILSLLAGLFLSVSALADTKPDDADIQRFHDLVATGGASAVAEALEQNRKLATARDALGS